MIPRKKELSNNFFLKSPYMFLTDVCFEKYKKKKTGHRACFRDMIGQTYPTYACTDTNHVRHFIVWGTFCGNGSQGS